MKVGKPSRIAFNDRDAREDDALCNKSETMYCFSTPWFKTYNKEWIDLYASAYKKVVENYEELLELEDSRKKDQGGRWYGMVNT